MMPPLIECKYSCSECGIYRQTVNIPARMDESVTDWMDKTAIPGICADHARRSPCCHPEVLTEFMIPVPEGIEKIGGPVTN